ILFILLQFQSDPTGLKPGDPAPSFVISNPLSGVQLVSDSLKGNVIVVDFWASWCMPSRKNNSQMGTLYNKYMKLNRRNKDRLVFIHYSMDTSKELWQVARARDKLNWPNQVCDFNGWE